MSIDIIVFNPQYWNFELGISPIMSGHVNKSSSRRQYWIGYRPAAILGDPIEVFT
jgi:hypothetical protein